MAIASYTPSIHDGTTLEQLFVARDDILEDGVDRVRDASQSGRLAHVIYTGVRGAGKTHLISLIHHRAIQLPGYGTEFTTSWLDEDPWRIRSFETLIDHIAAAKEHPDVGLTVVFAEGFDRILQTLGDDDQRRLRARVERDANWLLITSSTHLTDNLTKQARPFYGFLDHIELRPFTLDEAIAMLTRSAEVAGDEELATRLGQPDVRARLAAISHVAGTQPRLWAQLRDGLTVSTIDDMANLLITKFDDLTPYYQERLWGLAPTELQVVMEFIDNDHALTPKEVSGRTGIPQQTVASTIKRLNPTWLVPRAGMLQQFVDKRLTYYQLAEPLAHICPQLKKNTGRGTRMVLDFLSAWFSRTDSTRPRCDDECVLYQARSVMDALAALQRTHNATAVLQLPVALASLIEDQLAAASIGLVRLEAAVVAARAGGGQECLDQGLDALKGVDPEETRLAQISIAYLRALLGQPSAALRVLDFAFGAGGADLTFEERNLADAVLNLCPVGAGGRPYDQL